MRVPACMVCPCSRGARAKLLLYFFSAKFHDIRSNKENNRKSKTDNDLQFVQHWQIFCKKYKQTKTANNKNNSKNITNSFANSIHNNKIKKVNNKRGERTPPITLKWSFTTGSNRSKQRSPLHFGSFSGFNFVKHHSAQLYCHSPIFFQ